MFLNIEIEVHSNLRIDKKPIEFDLWHRSEMAGYIQIKIRYIFRRKNLTRVWKVPIGISPCFAIDAIRRTRNYPVYLTTPDVDLWGINS